MAAVKRWRKARVEREGRIPELARDWGTMNQYDLAYKYKTDRSTLRKIAKREGWPLGRRYAGRTPGANAAQLDPEPLYVRCAICWGKMDLKEPHVRCVGRAIPTPKEG